MIDSVYYVCGGDNTADSGNRSVIDKLKVICGNSMQKFFDREKEEIELSGEDKKVILEWENSSRIKIAYLNNIGECYLRIDGMKKEAKKIFDFLIRIKPDNGLAKLYRGYCEDEIGRMEDYFNEAFQYASDEIEIRSGYLIHKVDLYLNGIKKEECSNAIENFIFYNPYPYTLNMCLAVLHWVKDKYKDFPGINDFGSLKDKEENFYMHFSRIEFYNELGTRAFEKLRNEPGFHHLKSVERGMIMAYLIYLYEPIIKIRKKCHFQYENLQELRKTSGCGLVHYSKLDTLKALLDQTGTPHLRVSNSGYMNDSSEGETFFEKLEQVSDAQNFDFKKLIECYFHERQENPNNVLPRGGNVYITSLSTQADSFPMWNIYAEEERGCNIEFDEDFFDLKGDSWGVFRNDSKNEKLDYSISTYTDDDYPLYKIQYENCSESSADFFAERRKEIAARWNDVEKIVQKLVEKYRQEDIMEKEIVEKAADEIRAFVADRINEVRYLFKDKEYSFEGEVRLVRVVDINDSGTHTDGREIPRAFTEVDKEIKDIIVTLGSKISDEEVNEIATWLKHMGRVNGVRIAMRNRPRQPVYKSVSSS